ncbi:MAG: hypothetical protein GC155_03930 [Alphaproteobacteria bacterium]|nr:hypothetical protein [Alphaproteobacteria bacterium]
MLAAALACAAGPAVAQAAAAYEPPRTPDGHPDFQGVWTNGSLTTLERPSQFKGPTITKDQADAIARRTAERTAAGRMRTDPNSGAPPAGRGVGGYNNVYIDAGTTIGVVNGEYRTSWVVDPPDGKIPYSAAGRKIYQDDLMRRRTTFDGPEIRPLGERCVVGYGSSAGPPMINVLYNNQYQFVQTKNALMIDVEMNHDARIIRIGGKHQPPAMRRWMGDSIGWWDGDTLVVETVSMHPQESLRTNTNVTFYISEDAKITERFTRVGPDEILYQFQVDDPKIFTQVWKAEMPLRRSDGPVYEYACHEGNYSLPGILAGARADDRKGIHTVVNADGE